MKESISAFFPAYNDAATIGALVEKAFRVLESAGVDFEVIVIDDGSVDRTPQVLAQLQSRYGETFRVVTHPANRGYGAALRSGFAASTKDLIFYTDGDGQYDPEELVLLLELMAPHIGLVNGHKIARHDPWYRIWVGKIYNAVVRRVFHIRVRDVDCDFRLIRRDLLTQLQLRSDSGSICVEMLKGLQELGCAVAEVPVHHYARVAGRSQFFRWGSVKRTLQQLAALYRIHRNPSPRMSALVENSADISPK